MKKGSDREPLDSLVRSNDAQKKQFVQYHLSRAELSAIPQEITTAKTLLGQPYIWSYVLNDTSPYCSGFVGRAFRQAEIFELEPMTFINPITKKTDSFWVVFSQKLKMEAP